MKKLSAKEIVQKDMDALYIGNLNTVEFDLDLPAKGTYGSDITWKSGHDRFLTDQGKVTRPDYGTGERMIPLYATFRYEDVEMQKTYEVRILEAENQLKVSKVYPVQVEIEPGEAFYLPQAAIVETEKHDTISHPVTWLQEELSQKITQEAPFMQYEGKLTGTNISVIAEVSIRESGATECGKEKAGSESDGPAITVLQPKVQECRDAQIRLLEGSEFYRSQERMREFLLNVNDDQMLYNFRVASGLDTRHAPEMIGWDSSECQLKGHTTGHYMSALALCYHATGDDKIKEKAIYMVTEMERCQQAFARMDGVKEGFLSGYSEEQFDLLEVYTPYPKIWAPYYTLHKLLAGFIDCYRWIGLQEALEIAERMGMWTWNRLSRLPHKQLTRMWSMYIAGEFGGMNEAMAELAQLTGRDEFLKCARLFDNDKLFYPLMRGVDALSTMHANQHIPQVLGAMEIFKATGEKRYYKIAEVFWKAVTSARTYAPGGLGEGEMFHERGRIGDLLTKNSEESCASYNMLKLTKELYQYQPKAAYMDYYERTVTNHTLAAGDKKATGETTYFFPLGPGMKREFYYENSCCHGTGMESPFKYREAIYFEEKNCIYINLFISSELRSEEKGVIIRQKSAEKYPGQIQLYIKGSGYNTIKIRKPEWAEKYQILEAERQLEIEADTDGYLMLTGDFTEGKTYEIHFSYRFRYIPTPDKPELTAIQYGPYIMAALSEEQDFITFPYTEAEVGEKMIPQKHSLEFVCDGVTWIPLCMVDDQAYHAYVKCPETVKA